MRASGRSTLLTTRITGRRASSALRSPKRVCGSGPSDASTSSSTPSTIVSPRSTSPPKSAWPGVSTMLSFTPPCRTAVFLARIVMPFSRSRSIESITRSSTSWLARKAPDCQSIASTRVVFPWSTWAMMATLRRSSRRGMAATRVEGAEYPRPCGVLAAMHPIATEIETLAGAIRRAVAGGDGWTETAERVAEQLRRHLPSPDSLTAEQRVGHPDGYRSHLLHAEPDGSFSIVALTWLPGQETPIHDHVTWCVFGVIQGVEYEELYTLDA